MPRRYILAILSVFLVPGDAAFAAGPAPTMDFQGDWVIRPQGGARIVAKIRYSATLRKLYLEMHQTGVVMSSLRDLNTGEALMWSDTMKGMAMRLPTMKRDSAGGAFTGARKTIDGEDCALWRAESVTLCLTPDGIPVEAVGANFQARIEALTREKNAPGSFTAPSGLRIMGIPRGAPAMMPETGLPW